MSQAEGKITLLMPLPKYYNPDKEGERQPIEDEKFDLTAREVTEHFQGVPSFILSTAKPSGSGGTEDS